MKKTFKDEKLRQTNDKILKILELQTQSISINDISAKLETSPGALRSFMGRNDYMVAEGRFVKKLDKITIKEDLDTVSKTILILNYKTNNISDDDIASKLNVTAASLKSFMRRQEYKIVSKQYIKKGDEEVTSSNVKDNKKDTKISTKKDPKEVNNNDKAIIDKVLSLQIYNMPLIAISQVLDLQCYEVERIMLNNGYISDNGVFKVKPKPEKIKKEKPKKVKSKKAKKEEVKQEWINPAKKGVFNRELGVYVVNVQLVEILDLQHDNIPIKEIAKKMKMTNKALLEFMEEKNYELVNNKFELKKADIPKKTLDNDLGNKELENAAKKPAKRKVINKKEKINISKNDLDNLYELYEWYSQIKDNIK